MEKITGSWPLTSANIDLISEQLEAYLQSVKVDAKDLVRLRLSLETVLVQWQKSLTEKAVCQVKLGKRFGRPYVELQVAGPQVNPYEEKDEDDKFGDSSVTHLLLSNLGLEPTYTYTNGKNQVLLRPARKQLNPLAPLGMAVTLALLLGQLCLVILPLAAQKFLSEIFLTPLLDAFMRSISLFSGLMIFFSVLWGIVNIGDLTILSKMGKKLIGSFLLWTFLPMFLTLPLVFGFYQLDWSGTVNAAGAVSQIWQLLLNIIPSDPFSPFIKGYSLQIIFLSVLSGVLILILGKRATTLITCAGELNDFIQLGIGYVSKLMPGLVFVCIFKMVITGLPISILVLLKMILLIGLGSLVVKLVLAAALAKRGKASLALICRKLFPAYMVAFSTDSSAAAFNDTMHCCVHKLGIEQKMASFGVPLTNSLFKPADTITFPLMAIGMAAIFHQTVTFSQLIIVLIVSFFLSLATPSVPGGAISCLTILFLPLGLPGEALTLAIAVLQLLDFACTATNVWTDMTGLALVADSLHMLDRDILRKQV